MRQTLNAVANSWNTGIFVWTAGYTAQNPLTGVGGSDLASYLLGYPLEALQATANQTCRAAVLSRTVRYRRLARYQAAYF